MKKKIAQPGRKTGFEGSALRGFYRIGVSSLLAVTIFVFTGTPQAGATDKPLTPRYDFKPQTKEPLPEKCRQKPDGGPCKALFWKHYFDPKTSECKEFIYGGCEGTIPFETREECEQECLEPRAQPTS